MICETFVHVAKRIFIDKPETVTPPMSTRLPRPVMPMVTMILVLLDLSVPKTAGMWAADDPEGPVRERPMLIADPAEYHIGEMIRDLAFTDIHGVRGKLSDYADRKALVVAMRDEGCPLCRKYAPTLTAIERKFRADVQFLYVNTNEAETAQDVSEAVQSYGFAGKYVLDPEGLFGKIFRVESTTEVFVLDAGRTLRYRGAVDDQYGIGYVRNRPHRRFLEDALHALLQGEEVDIKATTAPGCKLEFAYQEGSIGKVTYHNRISRIVQQKCAACHRAGGVAPFRLTSYTDVRKRRRMIRYVLEKRIMPPWFADDQGGPWANDISLSDRERGDFLSWIAAKAPEGDPGDGPVARRWGGYGQWTIGKPDHIITFRPVKVRATGAMNYKYQYVKTDFPEDMYIQKMEIMPGAPSVVHHVLLFLEEPGLPMRKQQLGPGGFFSCYQPGLATETYAPGYGRLLPKGATIKYQLHLNADGKPHVERTRLGFIFAKEKPQHVIVTKAASTMRFRIPPGAEHYPVSAHFTFQQPAVLFAFVPHSHLRGVAWRYELQTPGGASRVLINLPHYDFNWQLRYILREPLSVPAGSRIKATAWYDNSADNPANPDPGATVRFGEQTWDEMMIGYLEYFPQTSAHTRQQAGVYP